MPEVWGEAVAIYKNCAEQPPQLCGGCCVGLLLVGGGAVAVHGLSIGYYKFRESWGFEHDKE